MPAARAGGPASYVIFRRYSGRDLVCLRSLQQCWRCPDGSASGTICFCGRTRGETTTVPQFCEAPIWFETGVRAKALDAGRFELDAVNGRLGLPSLTLWPRPWNYMVTTIGTPYP